MTLVAAVTAALVAVTAPFGLTPTGPSTAPVVKCWNVDGNWQNASKKSCTIIDKNKEPRPVGKHRQEHDCKEDKK